jgi:hypothetical protein
VIDMFDALLTCQGFDCGLIAENPAESLCDTSISITYGHVQQSIEWHESCTCVLVRFVEKNRIDAAYSSFSDGGTSVKTHFKLFALPSFATAAGFS